MKHVPEDNGTGACRGCGGRLATYSGVLQHRRGRQPGPQPRRRTVVVLRCGSCGRANRRLRLFRLTIEIKGAYNLIRRNAGQTRLCEPCWRKITANP